MRSLFLPVAAVLVAYAILSTVTPARDHVASQAYASTPLLTEAPEAPVQDSFSPTSLPPIQEPAATASNTCGCANCDCANCDCAVAVRTPVRTITRVVAAPVRSMVSSGYGSGGNDYSYSGYAGGYGSGGNDYSSYANGGGYGSGGDDYSGVASTTVRRGLFGRQIIRTSNRPRLFNGGVFSGNRTVSSGYGSSYCASCQ